MTMASYDRPAAFRIGRVFGDTFSVLGRNFGLCIGLAAIFSGIPTFLFQLWTQSQVAAALAPEAGAAFGWSSVASGIGGILVYFVFGALLQAALVRATIEDLNGQQPSFTDSLNRAIAVLLPVIGLSLVVGIGIGLASMLLLVPGIILFLRWAVAVPVLVQERLGVNDSLSRSANLTKGNRWALLGFFVILYVALIVLQMVLELAAGVVIPLVGDVIGAALLALASTISTMVASIASAVSYVELRYVKEGTDVKELAEIFA